MRAERNRVLRLKKELEKLVAELDALIKDVRNQYEPSQLEYASNDETTIIAIIVQKREVLTAVIELLANSTALATRRAIR